MNARLLDVLRKTPLYGPLRAAYRWSRGTSSPVEEGPDDACVITTTGDDNRIDWERTRSMVGCSVRIVGSGNVVEFDPEAQLDGCRVSIRGSGNHVTIGAVLAVGVVVGAAGDGNTVTIADGCVLRELSIGCQDSNNHITMLEGTEVAGTTQLTAMEGTSIRVGRRCLFSGGVHVRTGDSHSILDLEGRRINPSRDIVVEDHVWIGRNVTVLKGARLPESSVIGASAVVTKAFDTPHCVIAGNPARIVRRGVDWCVERIPCD